MEAAVKGEIYALSSPRCAPKTVDYALVDHVTFHDRNGLGDQFAVVGNLHQPRGGNDQSVWAVTRCPTRSRHCWSHTGAQLTLDAIATQSQD